MSWLEGRLRSLKKSKFSYFYITKASDYFDLGKRYGDGSLVKNEKAYEA